MRVHRLRESTEAVEEQDPIRNDAVGSTKKLSTQKRRELGQPTRTPSHAISFSNWNCAANEDFSSACPYTCLVPSASSHQVVCPSVRSLLHFSDSSICPQLVWSGWSRVELATSRSLTRIEAARGASMQREERARQSSK